MGFCNTGTYKSTHRAATHLENLEKFREFKSGQGNVCENRKSERKRVLAGTKFGQLILRKMFEIVATRCQILRLKCTKLPQTLLWEFTGLPQPPSWI